VGAEGRLDDLERDALLVGREHRLFASLHGDHAVSQCRADEETSARRRALAVSTYEATENGVDPRGRARWARSSASNARIERELVAELRQHAEPCGRELRVGIPHPSVQRIEEAKEQCEDTALRVQRMQNAPRPDERFECGIERSLCLEELHARRIDARFPELRHVVSRANIQTYDERVDRLERAELGRWPSRSSRGCAQRAELLGEELDHEIRVTDESAAKHECARRHALGGQPRRSTWHALSG
jgi:hypothetical protein